MIDKLQALPSSPLIYAMIPPPQIIDDIELENVANTVMPKQIKLIAREKQV
jgi:hypothetical protein